MSIKSFFKRRLAVPFLILFMLINFGLLINIPFSALYISLNTGFLILLFLFAIYSLLLVLKQKQSSRLYLILLVLTIVPFLSAWQALMYYDQPFLYGILSERLKILAFGGLLLVFLMERGMMDLSQIRKTTLNLALFIFIVLLILNIFVPASAIQEYDFVVSTSSRGYRFKLNHSLIVILYFFSILEAIRNKSWKHFGLALLILFYFIFLFKARSLTLSIGLATLILLSLQIRLYKLLSWSVIGFLLVLGISALGYLIFPSSTSKIIELFSSAINVFIGGEVTDSSSLSRISQFEIAKEGFVRHPILGNGFLSSRWEGGLHGIYGHFYPSDIGWMGVLYLYGIIGTLIYLIPFALTYKYSKGITMSKKGLEEESFVHAMIYTMLYFLIHSTTAGFLVKKLGIIIFVFSIIYYSFYQLKSKKSIDP